MAEPIRLFNTLSRAVEDFKPMRPGEVGLYSCGPTVYSYAHIGNMRAYIFADTLRRTLTYLGYKVNHVMNITDVGHLTGDTDDSGEDKLEVGSRREGLTAWDVAKKYTDAFFEHAQMLNITRPTIVCKATDYIPEQIAMVQALEKKGYTYTTSDGVYFDTSKFADYTKLGRLDVKGLQEGHRVEAGDKRNKTDFALWKFSKPEDKRAMEWDAPWGRGFPGWHIECSAMSVKLLGEQFDIHTGGVDHIPIHHTNEVAQSECATGKTPFVRYWMHGEFLILEDEKMSKSLGNVLTVATLAEKGFDPLAYRLLILQSHYRKQLRFSYDTLLAAQRGYERLNQLALKVKAEVKGPVSANLGPKGNVYRAQFREALANDLNMPQALASLFSALEDSGVTAPEKLALINEMDSIFGLSLLTERPPRGAEVPEELNKMLAARNQARADKQWAEADRLRKAILDAGYEILDNPTGSSLKKRL